MMPITRPELEILLDTPARRDYVVSAYADLTVKDGFNTFVETHLKNQSRAAAESLGGAEARKALDANIEGVRRAVREADPSAKGLAVFVSEARRLRHAVALDFPVENRLVLDEEPFVLPLLERWYGEPNYLIAVVDSHRLVLFEAYAGVPEPVQEVGREIPEMQRDKPRFTYKKRFAQTQHERLHGLDEDGFFKQVAAAVADRWKSGAFAGLILLGQAPVRAAVRRLLPKELGNGVVEEAEQTMTSKPEDVADDVARALDRWRQGRERQILDELHQRWKENHLVADGPTAVLDALQQGRATQVVIGPRRDLPGAACNDCGYRFGAPVATCPYCQGPCRSINAAQEILRMALRHRTPVHLFDRTLADDPLARAGGVSSLLRAEANWAPDPATAQATQGH
jgi:protein required for attachment to host cells